MGLFGAARLRGSQFAVVLDQPITLAVGGDIDRDFDFQLGPNTVQDQPVVVSFFIERATDLALEVTMNGLSFTRNYSPGIERTVHEVIGNAARPGANRLTLRVVAGSIRISDVIVWHQVFV
jgi:hypothetical protein